MKTILVPTDFSENSKGGMRFAINIARNTDIQLLFIHVAPLIYRTDESLVYAHLDLDKDEQSLELKNFIEQCYQEMGVEPQQYDFAIISGLRADLAILHYCTNRTDIDYISISTRGASGLNKLLGTNTGNLVTKSCVPVLVVPSAYQAAPIDLILYASDFKHYMKEIQQVVGFAKLFGARIEALHFQTNLPDERNFSSLAQAVDYNVHFRVEQKDVLHSLVDQLIKQVTSLKPAVLVLFTEQHRSFLQKVFLSNLAEELAFHPTIPILIFNKDEEKPIQ